MLIQQVQQTTNGVRITVSDKLQAQAREQSIIHSVLYGEPTEFEVQKALETFTAYQLDLTDINEVRKHSPRAMHKAMAIWRELGGIRKL